MHCLGDFFRIRGLLHRGGSDFGDLCRGAFDTLDDYYSGIANGYRLTYSNYPESPADEFSNYQLGFYAGDTWRVKPNLTLVYGLRLDMPTFPDTPAYNPLVEDIFGVRTDRIPDGNLLWSPRIGFNWDISGDSSKQLRGGVGLFTGRTPYVWISNNYGCTGIEQVTLRGYDVPFGGYKQSGIGRETHKMMLDHYQQTKNMLVSYDVNPLGFF